MKAIMRRSKEEEEEPEGINNKFISTLCPYKASVCFPTLPINQSPTLQSDSDSFFFCLDFFSAAAFASPFNK